MNRPIRYWHTSIFMYLLVALKKKKFVLLRLNTDCCILVTRFQKADSLVVQIEQEKPAGGRPA
jgi:hypothetical protein